MKVVKATGLVPVFSSKNRDNVFGVTPAVAAEGAIAGTLHLVDIPDEVETEEVDVAVPANFRGSNFTALDLRDLGIGNVDDKDLQATEKDGVVVIPQDWENLHWMSKNKLAKDILGEAYVVPDGEKKTDYDETVIREEVQRRADAADTGESA